MKKHILILLFLSLFCLQLATFAAAAEAEVDAFDVEDDDDEDVASFEENDAEDMALDGDDDDDDDLGDDEMGTFMEENAADPDVVQLPSGIQYKVLKSGSKSGAKSPRDDSYCRVHYEGKLTNGVVFDSTYAREQPVVFRTNQLIPGWQEALLLMKEGDEWEVVIPSALGYGDRAVGDKIPPNSDLIFRMALLDVDPEFTLWQQFQQFLRSPVEGLPIQLQMWQALVFFIYLGFRLFSKQLGRAVAGGKVSAEARHILVDSEKLVKELKQKLDKGASFEKLAKEHSKCPSGKQGGKLGKFKPGQMVKEFDKVCFDPKTKVGTVQGPVKTQFGWHLLVVDSRDGVEEEGKKDK